MPGSEDGEWALSDSDSDRPASPVRSGVAPPGASGDGAPTPLDRAAKAAQRHSRSRSRSRSSSVDPGRRQFVRRILDPAGHRSLPMPPTMRGAEWWQKPLLAGAEHLRFARPDRPGRPLRHESLLCGMMTETWALEAVGAVFETRLACDIKPAAKKFALKHRGGQLGHYFRTLEDASCGRAHCAIHMKQCSIEGSPDLVTIGLPCQPYSSARDQRAIKPQDHKLYETAFREFPEYLRSRKPGGFVAEEVLGFDRINHDTGLSFMQDWCHIVAQLGYSIRVHRLSAGTWSEGERERCLAQHRSAPASRRVLGRIALVSSTGHHR